eukprot:GFUD01004521.1.p1 GENE.GFUD01004521.1~~GFUD01004521.1.p1  ORF type:complete len:794 (+),score=179.39 GFUD01004521.1:244-2382(+)
MVECDRENKMKIEEACNNLKKDIRVLWRKLKMTGEPEQLPSGLTLLEQQKSLKTKLICLEERRTEIMQQFRSVIDEERALAAKLGLEGVYIDEDTIPEKEDMQQVEESLRKLVRVKEERETHMFTMKEEIVSLLDSLGMDLNATTLSSVLDGEEPFDSLKPSDMKSVQHTMVELRTTLEQKKVEVRTIMEQIAGLYTRLDILSGEQCPLAMGQVCGVEELIKEENFLQLKEEKNKLEKMKTENMMAIIDRAKKELVVLWDGCLVAKEEQSLFLGGIEAEVDADEALATVEGEIGRLQKFSSQHKETLQKIVAYMELCSLAEDLKERMQDPNRLFKSRGKAMVKEEQDRKRVNTIPRRKEELLSLAEHKGDIVVYGQSLSTLVEDYAEELKELFAPPTAKVTKNHQSNSLSSTRSGKSFNMTSSLRSNKTASPRSTKKLGRYHTSPAARKASRTLRHTPQSAQLPSPARSTRRHGKMVGVSPLARPNKRMIRSNTTLGTDRVKAMVSSRMQMPDLVPSIHLNDGTINQSVFSDNVPYNSTVCYENSVFGNVDVPDMTVDMENTVVLSGLINKMVAARDAAVMQDCLRIQNTKTIATTDGNNTRALPVAAGSKIPRQPTASHMATKATRKLRRSNSCSDMVLKSRKRGVQRPRLGSGPDGQENLPSIRESGSVGGSRPAMLRSNSCLTASGVKKGVAGPGRSSRVGPSSKLVLR